MSDPSDPRPDPDEEIIVNLPEASLDDLIAGLEASWQSTPEDAPATGESTESPTADAEPIVAEADAVIVTEEPATEAMEAPLEAAPAADASPAGPATAEADGPERRGAIRRDAHEFKGELRLAVAGFPMHLVNLSRTGLLAETNQRLCPGRTVDVFLRYGGVRKVLRATVIRSTMHAVAPNPVFRAALQFEDELALQDTEL
jgi:hypothetical protein